MGAATESGNRFPILCLAGLWLVGWITASIIYRKYSNKPFFPLVPDKAVFAEAWRSGRSLKNLLTRIGGGRNCLLVYVAEGQLTVVPVFPFNLMFLPEIYGLEFSAPIASVSIEEVTGPLRDKILFSLKSTGERFEITLNDARAFESALQSARPAEPMQRASTSANGWQAPLFRGFALVWGLFAVGFGFFGLAQDLDFRLRGETVTGQIVGHTGQAGDRGDVGILQYVVRNHTYQLTSIRGSGIYRIGDFEKVYYMPQQPASARENDLLSFDLLFASVGSLMLTLGLSLGFITRALERRMNL